MIIDNHVVVGDGYMASGRKQFTLEEIVPLCELGILRHDEMVETPITVGEWVYRVRLHLYRKA